MTNKLLPGQTYTTRSGETITFCPNYNGRPDAASDTPENAKHTGLTYYVRNVPGSQYYFGDGSWAGKRFNRGRVEGEIMNEDIVFEMNDRVFEQLSLFD